MKTLIASLIALTLMLSVPLFAWAGSSSDSNTVRPNTPQAARMIATLERAEHLDRLNAASYTGEDSDEGVAYYQKGSRSTLSLRNCKAVRRYPRTTCAAPWIIMTPSDSEA